MLQVIVQDLLLDLSRAARTARTWLIVSMR
jgi:hypothetical protein